MTTITAKIALPVFERIANRGKRYTAKKLLQYCASIADHADRLGITDRNPFHMERTSHPAVARLHERLHSLFPNHMIRAIDKIRRYSLQIPTCHRQHP